MWLLVAASALPLLIGRGQRLIWAARFWALACLSWILALASTRGWTGAFTPSETVVLVPAAIAVAAGVGLGIASFETDVAGDVFSWRQVVSAVAMAAVVLGVLPVAVGALDGRWGLPANGVEQSLTFVNRPDATVAYRVLWLGDPRALPLGGWPVDSGLSYALSGESLPDATLVWAPQVRPRRHGGDGPAVGPGWQHGPPGPPAGAAWRPLCGGGGRTQPDRLGGGLGQRAPAGRPAAGPAQPR